MDTAKLRALDQRHVWHPYAGMGTGVPAYPVVSAKGVRFRLADGRELIDGMSSWWCAIHGYGQPDIDRALRTQIKKMAHVMFGGLTHEPAVQLATRLVSLTPPALQTVFFVDSGSVAVEVAMKMAIQYWHAYGRPDKHRFLTIKNGYHGDTLGAMSVCDPVTGMHTLFQGVLNPQYFVPAPACRFGTLCRDDDIAPLEKTLAHKHQQIAAVILEPIVQGAGGMRFYSADYLARVRALCDRHKVLLILDEIATGFGRTGKLFAAEHACVVADILCVGKALTGGYLSLAATLTTREVSETISGSPPNALMHGPTFMGNPLACTAALTSLDLLFALPWQTRIAKIASHLADGLAPCRGLPGVVDVRVLGGIGVVELAYAVDLAVLQPYFVNAGVWIRPFGKLIYLMPPFIISPDDLAALTSAVVTACRTLIKTSTDC